MPSDEPNAREAGGLTAWSRAQQAALYHRQIVEQQTRDETKAEKDEKEKKEKKKHDKEVVKPDKITAASVVAKILHSWCPALYEFLDIFGPPHIGLPIFITLHVLYWATTPTYLSLLLPLPLTHLLPIALSLKSLFSPSATIEKAYDEAKRTRQKTKEDLKKQGKEQAEFPDPPTPPEGWQMCVRDRKGWLAYWVWVGGVEYLELLCFGDQVAGLVWWPKIKAVFFIALYFVWEVDEKGHQTVGALKFVEPFLPVPHEEKKEKVDKGDEEKGKEDKKREDPRKRK